MDRKIEQKDQVIQITWFFVYILWYEILQILDKLFTNGKNYNIIESVKKYKEEDYKMNKLSIKLLSVLAIVLFIAVIPVVVLATNEDISVVSTINESGDQEYIIYVNGYTDKQFKYALSNNANPKVMDLVYINSIADLGENQVAYIGANDIKKLTGSTIYMWVKDQNENLILNGIEIDFNKSLSKEKIDSIESITKRIKVEIAENQEATEATNPVRQEEINGIVETSKVGYVKITDNKKAKYYFERVKTSDSEEYKKLMELAEKIQNEYNGMDMYSKVQTGIEFNDLYSKLVEEANWQEVEKMTIAQPESKIEGEGEGDKYVVLLKKVAGNDVTTDAQFLTASYNYEPSTEKEKIITQETTKLPITYDGIALIVALVIVVGALTFVAIRMKKINKDEQK